MNQSLKKRIAPFTLVAVALFAQPASACDICSVYTMLGARGSNVGAYAGLFEQYSDFGTLLLDGDEIANADDQNVRSSISQVIVGYQLNRRFGVQANVPLIDRSFRRPEEGGIESGSESGVGDVSVVAIWRPIERYTGEGARVLSLLGGVKLPTGDSDRLAEELEEDHHDGEGEEHLESHRASVLQVHDEHEGHGASGVHGHDLALGSGSTDVILGASAFVSQKRFYTRFAVQYAVRSEGDFDYRYANDTTWSVEPGVFAWLSHDHTLAVGVGISGEKKGLDTLRGASLPDTGIEAIYAGPAISYSHGDGLYGELNVDLPVEQEPTELQIVPDWRARLAFTYRF